MYTNSTIMIIVNSSDGYNDKLSDIYKQKNVVLLTNYVVILDLFKKNINLFINIFNNLKQS